MSLPSGPFTRLPTSLWRIAFTVTAVCIYYILRQKAEGMEIGWLGNAFLLFLSGLVAGNLFFAFDRRESLHSVLPEWLRPFWVRLLVAITVRLALTGLVTDLNLPHFYDSVLGLSFILISVPYLISWNWSEGQFYSTDPFLADFDGNRSVPYIRRRSVAIIFYAPVVVYNFMGRDQDPVLAWILVGLCSLPVLFGGLMLIPGSYGLRLTEEGFVMVRYWRRFTFHWAEVSDFNIVPEGVQFHFSEIQSDLAPEWRKRKCYGKSVTIGNQYDFSCPSLCQIMNERRALALAKL